MSSKRFWLFVKILVTTSLFVWLGSKLDIKRVLQVARGAETIYFVAALCAGLCVPLCLALRLKLLLRTSGYSIPLASLWRLTWGGQFFNMVLPGSTGGDLYKMVELSRALGTSAIKAPGIIIADRLFALLGLMIFASLGLLTNTFPVAQFFQGDIHIPNWLKAGLLGGFVLFALLLALSYRLPRVQVLRAHLSRIFKEVAGYFWAGQTTLLLAMGAMAVHLVVFLSVYFIGRALGLNLSYFQVLAFIPLLMIILMIPLTVNGHGLREVVLIGYFSWMQLGGASGAGTRELAVAFSFGMVSIDLLSSVPGGLWWLLNRQSQPLVIESAQAR